MDSKEPKIEEAPLSLRSGLVEAQQVTSTNKNKTKPKKKNQGVLQLAKKKLAEHNRRVREKMKGGSTQFKDPKDPGTTGASYGARTIIIIILSQDASLRPAPSGPLAAYVKGLILFVCQNKISDNKLVKALTDSATLPGLAAGIGLVAKKVIEEPMTSDPCSNLMIYVKKDICHLKNVQPI